MTFRLGVVGHEDTLARVMEIVEEHFDDIELFTEEFGDDARLEDAADRIEEMQTRCDGILYSRKEPYLLISGQMHHTVPVRYVDVDSSQLLISLLQANIRYGLRPTRLSIDSFPPAAAMEALTTVGIPKERLVLHDATHPPGEAGVVHGALQRHLRHYEAGAELCITNMMEVYRSLRERDIPATIMRPAPEAYVHEIRNLMLRHRLRHQQPSPLAIMHIRLRYKDKYRYYGAMPLREVDDLGRAAQHIAVFAERLDGAMFQQSRWEYVILCSRPLLETTTQQFVDIDLMQTMNVDTAFDVAVGIGCGATVKEASANALLAINETAMSQGTNAVIVLAPGHVVGPIRPKSEHYPEPSAAETRLDQIAADTGISRPVLQRLHTAARRRNFNLFTSVQLADVLDVTPRTANRIIQRLLDHRYAAIEGRDLTQRAGRPARVIRLLF